MYYLRISRGLPLSCIAKNIFQKWRELNILTGSVVESQVYLLMPQLLTEDIVHTTSELLQFTEATEEDPTGCHLAGINIVSGLVLEAKSMWCQGSGRMV